MMQKVFLGATILLLTTSCLKEKTIEPVVLEDPCASTVSFQDELMPEIFNVTCNTSGCHDAGTSSAGHVFENHDQISSKADVIFLAIQHDASVTPMPYGGEKLADSLIQKFDCWIQQGKLNN